MIEILRLVVLLFFAIPLFIFGTYGLIILYYGKLRPTRNENGKQKFEGVPEPLVSVITPTHNEEKIIAKKVENLLASKYPKEKLEIIFVDDSDDSTPKILEAYTLRFPNIRLIRFSKRMGYSPCMVAGVTESKGDVFVFSDAGSYHDEDTITNLVRHFSDSRIGAVTGKDVILNVDEGVGSSEALYMKIYDFVRTAETNMDSTFYFKGEASAVRKDLISGLSSYGATFDTAIALFVRQKGYKTVFDSEAKFYEYAPKVRNERVQQKTIRAANWIKILLKFRSMAFNRKYGKFGMFTLPANFGMLMVAPVAILLGFCSLAALTFFDPFFSLYVWGSIGVIALFSLALSKYLLGTFLDFEFSLLKAMYEVAFTKKKHDQIDTVLSTRR
jgi:cellulose synthase/poly-beta-1,6-N-acetylglucosamine synthase-like glycosyltransferase